jgi:ABC-2 type transport system ATP-binding protein
MAVEETKKHIINTRKMTKAYGHLLALDSIDLNIPYGAVGLLGPNGAGKSTLIKCLLGLVRITSGSGTVLGNDVKSMDAGLMIRQKIGYMPESDCLIPDLDAVELVKYMGELSGLPPMTAMQRSHEVLDYIGVQEERYRKIKTYSTGMKQKIKLAQAIVHDPVLLFLDEPTNGMDPQGREEMLTLIKDISSNHKKNVIFSSHLLPDVEFICSYAVMIAGGRLVIQGDIEELTRSAKMLEIRIKGDGGKFKSILTSEGFDFTQRGSIFIVSGDKDTLSIIYQALKGTDIQLRHAIPAKLSLEDIFVSNIKELGEVGSR